MSDNKLTEMIQSSLESIKTMLDANTIIGTPIETPSKTVIIPISKISVGFAAGGNDYAAKNAPDKKNNFGGGGGTGVTVTPVGFLVVNELGSVEMLNVNNPTMSNGIGASIETIITKAPDIINKLKALMAKKKAEKLAKAPIDAEQPATDEQPEE